MEIKPVGAVPVARSYTVHRVIPAEEAETKGTDDIGSGTVKRTETGSSASKDRQEDAEEKLAVGDRIMIRYIDDERARPESYILSDKDNDPKNGVLSLLSPLGRALSEAGPGDEFTVRDGDHERTVLFVAVERETAQAA
jgi:transcription elongation GreA/GreB family factor